MKIYNSLTRTKEELTPLKPGHVGIYCCGPTVYDEPHIGHARSAYIFDIIRRYLKYRGYEVLFVRNVTDVDDKIIDKARKEWPGEDLNDAVKKVSQKYLDAYHRGMDALGIMRPDREPKATEYIEKMQLFIGQLIDNGSAYQSGGDVYFNTRSSNGYGKLSNRNIEKMEAGAKVHPGETKKDPLDFALWKSAKEGEPSWPSPWGAGRPGWHIECSVMSSDILGDEFDIHGGGIDLIFPHHENEIAQSEGAGKKFARQWIHNGLLTINAQKMAKSLGNFITISDFMNKYRNADLLKVFFLSAHYSHPVDYSEEKIDEVKKAIERIIILRKKVFDNYKTADMGDIFKSGFGGVKHFRDAFIMAMDDDFNMPQALAVLFDMVHSCNQLLDSDDGQKGFKLNYAMSIMEEMINVFGLDLFETVSFAVSEEEIASAVADRARLRKEKRFNDADEIRKALDEKGVILEDTKGGTSWRRKF